MIVYRDALIVNRAQASSVCNRWGGVRTACHSGPQFGITSQSMAFPIWEIAESSVLGRQIFRLPTTTPRRCDQSLLLTVVISFHKAFCIGISSLDVCVDYAEFYVIGIVCS